MHVSSAVRWRAVLAPIAALALLPAAAHAELTVALVGADALEGRTMTFIAMGATNETNDIYAKFRLAAGVPCTPS